MSSRVASVSGGAVVRWNRSVNRVNARFDTIAPDFQWRCKWIMVWNDFFGSVLKNSTVIFGYGFRLFESFVHASHKLGMVVVVSFDDKV